MAPPGLAVTGMPRLFHTSDTHLGHQQYHATSPAGLNQREEDIYAAFHAVIDQAVQERPDVFIHAGDLFDGVRPSNRALATALEGFLKLSRAGIPTVLIAGNHEHPKMRETGSPFRLLAHLDHIHPVYQAQAETHTFGDVHVHAVPQCSDNQELARQIEGLDRTAPGRHVLVVHGAVHSLDAFGHAEFNELTLQTRWFQGFDYVALGHYHGRHEVTHNAWYCGAPERVSMAESGEEKGYLDVRLDRRPHITFRPLAGRPYMDLPALDATGMDAAQVLEATETACTRVPEGAVARLKIHNLAADLRGVLDLRGLQRAAPQALVFEVKPTWRDEDARVRGGAHIGGLLEEFEQYAAAHPVENLDRERLLAMARTVLQEDA
jgi:DNA repair protein SbcD/Mre11